MIEMIGELDSYRFMTWNEFNSALNTQDTAIKIFLAFLIPGITSFFIPRLISRNSKLNGFQKMFLEINSGISLHLEKMAMIKLQGKAEKETMYESSIA